MSQKKFESITALEALYDACILDDTFGPVVENPKAREAGAQLDAFIEAHGEDDKTISANTDLVSDCLYFAARHGFTQGFRVAVALMSNSTVAIPRS